MPIASAPPKRSTPPASLVVTFCLFGFRFTFEAIDPVFFPPGAAGNAFRGAFGHIFRRIACPPECTSAKSCEVRSQCAYANLFEPACLDGPSGLRDAPRPFVIRAGALDGCSFPPGDSFSIDLHIFDLHEPAVAYFVAAFHELIREGIGVQRGRIRLIQVSALDAGRRVATCIYRAGEFVTQDPPDCIELNLDPWEHPRDRPVTLRFATPTELKGDGAILREAPFGVVLARARDRIATLHQLYGGGPLDLDFRGMTQRAAEIKTVSSALRWESHQRRSSRTHQTHALGGFVGEVSYAGDLAEFLPFLHAAYWTGIGRQTVWGKGAVELIWSGPVEPFPA
jgi:CRISPR-associated endoribonuclease Cas6